MKGIDFESPTPEERIAKAKRYFEVFPPDEIAQLIREGMTLGDARLKVYKERG